MLFEISHFTEYQYAEPVNLDTHYLRLRPREDGSQRLRRFRLDLEPRAAGVSMQLEPDGNVALVARFTQSVRQLRIHASSTVETHHRNPFDFVITEPGIFSLPARYRGELGMVLGPARQEVAGPRVVALAEAIAAECGFDTLQFLARLNTQLFRTMKVAVRPEGTPMDPEDCLACGEGACRDLTVVYMAACRHMGLGARFVSGYQMTDPNEQEHYMHAWAEVYLPGGGWRGYDPTHGIAVDEHFVPVAASPTPLLATPIEGAYSPAQVPCTMRVILDVRTSCPLPNPAPAVPLV